jgi:hypothetical protein
VAADLSSSVVIAISTAFLSPLTPCRYSHRQAILKLPRSILSTRQQHGYHLHHVEQQGCAIRCSLSQRTHRVRRVIIIFDSFSLNLTSHISYTSTSTSNAAATYPNRQTCLSNILI